MRSPRDFRFNASLRAARIARRWPASRRLFVDLFLEAQERAPNEIILDLDATDDPVHGEQEGRFFHGYYDCYCYLPLPESTASIGSWRSSSWSLRSS